MIKIPHAWPAALRITSDQSAVLFGCQGIANLIGRIKGRNTISPPEAMGAILNQARTARGLQKLKAWVNSLQWRRRDRERRHALPSLGACLDTTGNFYVGDYGNQRALAYGATERYHHKRGAPHAPRSLSSLAVFHHARCMIHSREAGSPKSVQPTT